MGSLVPAVLSRLAKELKELTRQPCEGIKVAVETAAPEQTALCEQPPLRTSLCGFKRMSKSQMLPVRRPCRCCCTTTTSQTSRQSSRAQVRLAMLASCQHI